MGESLGEARSPNEHAAGENLIVLVNQTPWQLAILQANGLER